jgi:hypothetical protein
MAGIIEVDNNLLGTYFDSFITIVKFIVIIVYAISSYFNGVNFEVFKQNSF